jgi:hypothetical protein
MTVYRIVCALDRLEERDSRIAREHATLQAPNPLRRDGLHVKAALIIALFLVVFSGCVGGCTSGWWAPCTWFDGCTIHETPVRCLKENAR